MTSRIRASLSVPSPGANLSRIRLAQTQKPFHEFLADQLFRDLDIELAIKPVDEPSRFRPMKRLSSEQRRVRMHFVEEFGNHQRSGQCGAVGFDQHRHSTHWVYGQKFLTPPPDIFGFHFEINALLTKDDANLA